MTWKIGGDYGSGGGAGCPMTVRLVVQIRSILSQSVIVPLSKTKTVGGAVRCKLAAMLQSVCPGAAVASHVA